MNGIIQALIPSGLQAKVGVIYAVAGSALTYAFDWNDALALLCYVMMLDYLSGVMASYFNPELDLDSHIGFMGICKKIAILLLVSLMYRLSVALGQPMVYFAIIWFYVGNESLSVVENLAKCGVPFPKKLKDSLKQLKEMEGDKKL